MHKGFQIVDSLEFSTEDISVGKRIFDEHKTRILGSLSKHILENGNVDASSMEDDWFPKIEADVFISHSSKDKETAYGLAGWLHRQFELNAFVDSAIWKNSTDLLEQIDHKFCKNEDGKSFSYEKRNHSTSHVHMMLSMALTKMIDTSECILFYKTDNSIPITEPIDSTASPWIYSELVATQLIRRKETGRSQVQILNEMGMMMKFAQEEFPIFQYEVPLKHLKKIDKLILDQWDVKWKAQKATHPLDILYYLSK